MGIIAYAAFGLAALRATTEFWASATFTLAIVLQLIATLAAVLRRGPPRAFWIGFCLFGWSCLVLVFAPWFSKEVAPRLLSTYVMDSWQSVIQGKRETTTRSLKIQQGYSTLWTQQKIDAATGLTADELKKLFQRIGHSLLAPIAGLLGGALAACFVSHGSIAAKGGSDLNLP